MTRFEQNAPWLHFPESPLVEIGYLASVFRDTTNSYKYYWFLAILEAIKEQCQFVSLDLLTAHMISQIWYPLHYFHLSFGSLDQLGRVATYLKQQRNLPINVNASIKMVISGNEKLALQVSI